MTRKTSAAQAVAVDRRQMLQRLGLVAVAAYAAPTLLTLTPARASSGGGSFSAASGPSGGGRRSTRSSSGSGPSRPHRSRASGPSHRSSSARGCSFSGGSGGSDGCRSPVQGQHRPRLLRRFFGGSG